MKIERMLFVAAIVSLMWVTWAAQVYVKDTDGAAFGRGRMEGPREMKSAPEVRESLAPYVDRGEIAGVVSVLSDADYNESWDCLGWADAENRVPMRPDTVFAVFSMTKTFTGCAIMIAVDRSILKMDDRVEKYLPEFRQVENKVTIRDCMCHITGIAGGNTDTIHTGVPVREQARKWAREGVCKRKIGEDFVYGNSSIATAAACLEVASGVPYDRFLKENILDPLGMKDTTFTPDEGQLRRLVKAYTTKGGPFRPASDRCSGQLRFPVDHRIYPMPSAGLYSTPADMIRFSQMLAHHGEWKGRRIVSRKTFDGIWAVKHTAQPSTSRSPLCSTNPSAGMHSSHSAASARATPIQITRPGFFRMTSHAATGTSTTYSAVINPALPALVVTSPTCCSEDAAKSSTPQIRPEIRCSPGSGSG